MSCGKCSACLKILVILAVVGYCLAMLVVSINNYSDYEDHQFRINSNAMGLTCQDLCGPDYTYSRDYHTCCNVGYSYTCSSRSDCKTKMLADLDSLMQQAAEQMLIYTILVVVILYCLCKNKCQPCRDLSERNPYNYNRSYGANDNRSSMIDPIHLDQEPIIVYRLPQKPNEAVEGLRESFVVKDHDDNCAICLQGLQEDKVIRLSCMHLFHGACIREWIAKHNSCPVCRMPN